MKNAVRLLLSSHVTVAFFSIVTAFCLWQLLSKSQMLEYTVSLPLVVYEQQKIVYEGLLEVRMRSMREHARMLLLQPPPVVLYREERSGKSMVITPDDIIVPETVTLIDYIPRSINVS